MIDLQKIQPDISLLGARLYHSLKSLLSLEETLPYRALEFSICEAFGFNHVGDGNFYADGVRGNIQASVKTRKLEPHILKRLPGRNFQSHPETFLGMHSNKKQKKEWDGLEIVQRRQALEFDEMLLTPEQIGIATLKGFHQNVLDSYRKFNTTESIEIIGVHGYNHNKNLYMMSLFWDEYKFRNPQDIKWTRDGNGVDGYDIHTNRIVVTRVDGNAKRESTCFKEHKDLTKYIYSAKIELPIPDPWVFNKDIILEEINNRRK
jgi:hypothetical protein